jgi:Asp-tRNA(Asn)/Glu-tRNA(Gln) amidotransferase A subunit family amidase
MTVNPANFGAASAPGDLARLSAADMVAGYKAGRFDPVDVIDHTVSALRRSDAVCNLVVTDLYDEAVSAAKAIAQRYRKGTESRPLAGVPVTVKDLVFVAGKPAKAGAPSLAGFVPQVDAHVVRRLRVAFSADFGYASIDPQVRAAFTTAVDLVASAGAELVEFPFVLDPQMLDKVLKPIAFTEQAASVGDRGEDAFVDSDDEFRAVLQKGLGYSGADYMAATHLRTRLRSQFVELFGTVDILLTPTVAVTAFAAGTLGASRVDGRPVDAHLGWSPFTWPVNLCGLPAATVACGRDSSGMPIGLQMIAPWMRESSIIALAGAFEEMRPWAELWPPLNFQ